MSPSVFIVRRPSATKGVRYQVRFRLGGREARPQSAGTFPTRKEAEARARWVAGEIAAMRVPDLARLRAGPAALSVIGVVEEWLRGRIDLSPKTVANYGPALARLRQAPFARQPLEHLEPAAVSAWMASLVEQGVGRPALVTALGALRQALDSYRDPNPARHRSIRLPRAEHQEVNPPTHGHWQLILDGVTARMRLPLRVLEGTGLRVGELQALRFGDLDMRGGRVRVRGGKTRAARRLVPLPPALVADLEALRPREDRDPEALVFSPLSEGALRMAMRRACLAAGIPVYSPHDLRHRYISLLVASGMDPAAVAALAGHTRKSLTLDVYSHVLLD